jgi:hypothetical protein
VMSPKPGALGYWFLLGIHFDTCYRVQRTCRTYQFDPICQLRYGVSRSKAECHEYQYASSVRCHHRHRCSPFIVHHVAPASCLGMFIDQSLPWKMFADREQAR